MSASKSNVQLAASALEVLLKDGKEKALASIKQQKGSTARVIKATIRNLDRDREHIEDIVAESILHESGRLDRFGSMILIVAAVAPLLGLLGTVTGMIATFDIITEFGTGDPKLLSGGISIALVTTELGLIVAIPVLMLGNTLSAWAERIKDSMEHSALHLINEYTKQS
ncbi:MotA/TolQ/ExbB proton channel family protein [Sulfurimonas sp. MAG313]|nr:MotA/TolQ/ExbB proton channel family protein [Sulfurimonas sp. MAG313]